MQVNTPTFKSTLLNIRISQEHLHLIEQAAESLDKTVSDFVCEVALHEALTALLDKSVFQLEAEVWDKFNVALDTSPAKNPRLEALLSRKPVWEA